MNPSTPNSEIAAVLETMRQGLMQQDAGMIAEAYVADATIFDLAPPLSHPFDAEELQKWLGKWAGPVKQDLRDFRLTVSGDLAVGHGLAHISAQTQSGETAAWWMRLTVCLSRQHDRWQIIHEHTSVPFHMDGSFRAAVDLEP